MTGGDMAASMWNDLHDFFHSVLLKIGSGFRPDERNGGIRASR